MTKPRWFAAWKDGSGLPEMVAIPPTSLVLPGNYLVVAKGFAIGRCAVSFAEMDAYALASGLTCPPDEGWGRGSLPAINVSFHDALNYCAWLTERTGRDYRLPSAAEWELAARSGCRDRFWWGDDLDIGDANYQDTPGYGTFPVRSLRANPWGLYNTLGNVAEWTHELGLSNQPGKSVAALRGGHWASKPEELHLSRRDWAAADTRSNRVGFRVAADL